MSNISGKALVNSCLFLIVGISCLWVNLTYKHSMYYFGENLIEMSLKIEESPKNFHRKHSQSRYYFKTVEYPCEFWLSGEAYDIIEHNQVIKKLIDQIAPGDSVTIQIKTNDKNLLDQSSTIIRVMGFESQNTRLIQPETVEKKERKSFIISIIFSIIASLTGILIFCYNWKKSP